MAIGCGAKLSKCLLLIFNILFWLSGAALIGAGIFVLVSPDLKFITDYATKDSVINLAGYILIGTGCFIFVVGFCGCCGAIRESRCLLGFYIFFLFLVFAIELGSGVFVAIRRKTLEKDFKAVLVYNFEKNNDQTPNEIKKSKFAGYNTFQKMFGEIFESQMNCCGINSFRDYKSTRFSNGSDPYNGLNVSAFCCKSLKSSKSSYADWWQSEKAFESYRSCIDGGTYNKEGCFEKSLALLGARLPILIGVGIGVAFLQLAGIIFAFCLCRNSNFEEQ